MSLHLGILLALLCAVATNLAFLYKHRGVCAAPAVDIRRPLKAARGLFGSRFFALGMAVALGAWLLHVAALALAPMSIVQAVLSGGVVLLAVMAERFFGLEVGPRQWGGVALTGAGLALLAITAPAVAHHDSAAFSSTAMIAFEGGLILLGALLVLGPRLGGPSEHHGIMLGASAGVLFGVSDVAIKALTGLVADHGAIGLLSPWLVLTVLASVAAFYASARGLQDGEAVPVITVTGAAASVSCIAGGILVFGDPLPGNPLGIILQIAAFLMVLAAAVLAPAPVRAVRQAA